jgi:type I restriction enzyme, S subunit
MNDHRPQTANLPIDPTAFRETEIGPIPADWEISPLGEVATVSYGKARPRTIGPYPAIGSGGIFAWVDSYLLAGPTLIVGRKGNAGQVWLEEGPNWPSDTTFYLTLTDAVDIRFLHAQLTVRPPTGEHARTTLPSLPRPDLENQPIPLPPLPEQRRIAAVLSAIQDAIAAQEDVIAAARTLKRSLMQRLFTYGPGREPAETQETEIGEIPVGWEVHTLGELCDESGGLVQTGPFGSQLHAADYVEVGIPTVMPQDIIDNRISTKNVARITEADHSRLSRYHLKNGDIIYARRGDIGRRALVTEEENGWLCGTGSLFIRVEGDGTNPLFLHHYMGKEEVVQFVYNRAVGSTMLNLNSRILRSIPVAHPEKNEQDLIAEWLSAVDTKIAAEEDRKTALEAIFKSMLHQLMTGQIRLLSDEGLPVG